MQSTLSCSRNSPCATPFTVSFLSRVPFRHPSSPPAIPTFQFNVQLILMLIFEREEWFLTQFMESVEIGLHIRDVCV